VGYHVVRCARVSNKEACGRPKLGGCKCHQVRWGIGEEGDDVFWKLDSLNALWVNRGAAAAAGGFTEDVKIWVVSGGRVGDWVFGSGVRGAWIEGNV
jgi:hypothetical protein